VENRQTKSDHVMMPRLFNLYPENIYSGQYPENRPENAKIMQQPLLSNPSTSSFKSSEAIKTIVPITKQEYYDGEDSRLFINRPYVRWAQPLEEESPDTDDDYNTDNKYRAASYRQWDDSIFYSMRLLNYALRGVPNTYNCLPKNQQLAVNKKLENSHLQVKILILT